MFGMSARYTGLALLALINVSSCSTETTSALFVGDFCLNESTELDLVRETITSLALSLEMAVHDRSLDASSELRRIAEAARGSPEWYFNPLLMLTVESESGSRLVATNAGLANQVAVTISGGSDETEAQEFASLALARLGARWKVREHPRGSGIQQDDNCLRNRASPQ